MEKEQLVALVVGAQNGDAAATNELFNAFYNDLYYFALKTVKDDDLALDVTQEAFVEIITTIGNLKEPAAFVTWAKQITYHQCTRYFKKKKDVLVDEDEDGKTVFDDLKEENAEFIPDEALDKTDFKKTILSLLDELSEEQRSAVMMYYFDEMSVSQIAEIQGVSEGTIKSRLNYARKAIKASVEDYEKKNNIKLHAIPFFPFLKWIFGSSQNAMPLASAKIVAEGVTAATGTAVSATATAAASGAAATAATASAAGIGAKIAAIPLVTKIVAATVAAAVVVGGTTTAIVLSNDDDPYQNSLYAQMEEEPQSKEDLLLGVYAGNYVDYVTGNEDTPFELTVFKDEEDYRALFRYYDRPALVDPDGTLYMSVVYDEATDEYVLTNLSEGEYINAGYWLSKPILYSISEIRGKLNGDTLSGETPVKFSAVRLKTSAGELILEGTIPEGCTYTRANGTVLTEGQPFPKTCTPGDVVSYGDYVYGYECFYTGHEENAETDWYLWKDGFDSGDSGVIESDVFDAWSVMVKDRTKSSYGEVVSKINGKPIKTLYATYYGCENMTEAPKIPSTITAMTASYYGCTSLTTAPTIPMGVERIMVSFRGCTSLSGDVEINATLDKSSEWYYCDTFSDTTCSINLTGATVEADLILIAKASNNRNITVNGKAVNYEETRFETDDWFSEGSNANSSETKQSFVVPEGCTYTVSATGKVYSAGQVVTSLPQKGDTFVTSDYTYKYDYYYRRSPMDSSVIEWTDYDHMEGWGVRTNDQTKQSYAPIEKSINGAPIKALTGAFRDCVSMTVVPELPEGCLNYEDAFYNCRSLKSVDKIPNGAVDLYCAFFNCTSLEKTPYLPEGIDNLGFAFSGCKSLKTVTNLPNSVTAMAGTFSECVNLTSVPNLPSRLENMNWTFMGCESLVQAPSIPSTVKQFTAAFMTCTSLEGTIEINAILDKSNLSCGGTCTICKEENTICLECIGCCKYSMCFRNTRLPITLVGKCPELEEMASTALDGNVTAG